MDVVGSVGVSSWVWNYSFWLERAELSFASRVWHESSRWKKSTQKLDLLTNWESKVMVLDLCG